MTILANLRPLRDSMSRQGVRRQRFAYQHRQGSRVVRFDVVFLMDTQPWHLLFGARGASPLGMLFEVRTDLSVKAFLDPKEYKSLCEILGISYNPADRFSPAKFLADFDGSGQIPSAASPANVPRPEDVPRPARHVSDHEKPYFWHWKPNGPDRQVSVENLKRTALCFGQRFAELCRTKNVSSCWTADPERAVRAEPPPGNRS